MERATSVLFVTVLHFKSKPLPRTVQLTYVKAVCLVYNSSLCQPPSLNVLTRPCALLNALTFTFLALQSWACVKHVVIHLPKHIHVVQPQPEVLLYNSTAFRIVDLYIVRVLHFCTYLLCILLCFTKLPVCDLCMKKKWYEQSTALPSAEVLQLPLTTFPTVRSAVSDFTSSRSLTFGSVLISVPLLQ